MKKQRFLIVLICGLVGIEFLGSGMFIFAATPIMNAIGAAPQKFALVQMAYAVGNIFMVATQQWMVQRFGYRQYLLLTLLLFGMGVVGSALAGSLPEMIIARLLHGMGGGAFFLSSRILIPLLFLVPLRPLASRCFLLAIFGTGVVSPALSAILVDGWGWEWIFWVQVPIVVILAAGVAGLMPRQLGKSREPIRWSFLPIGLLLIAVSLVQWVFTEANYKLVDRPEQLAIALLVGVAFFGLFGLHQWRHDVPLLHLRDLTNSTFLTGIGMFAVYYFIINFNNYLFPVYAEYGLGLSVITTGWLNSFSAGVTFVGVVLYSFYSAKLSNKRAMMMAGCLCMAASAWWMALLPIDAPIFALLGPLSVKGLFGVLMILPASALTWSALGDTHFAKGYQAKNLMRQMMISLASAASAIAMQNGRMAQSKESTSTLGIGLDSNLEMQAVFRAGQDLYVWIGIMAAAAAIIVSVQKKLR